MKRTWSIGIAALSLVFGLSAGTASAAPLTGMTVDFLNGEGTLSGFFQLDLATKTIIDWDLTVTAFNCATSVVCESSGFPALEYSKANSSSQVGFTFGAQSILFIRQNVFGASSVLSFVMNCGGNNNDCLGTAADGSSIPLFSAGESRSIVPIARSLALASLTVTDPEGVLSFNVVSGGGGGGDDTHVPEPASLAMMSLGLATAAARKFRKAKAA